MLIKGQADIEVSISDAGYIILKQRNDINDEQTIEFAPAYGVKLKEAIGSLQEFAEARFQKAPLHDE